MAKVKNAKSRLRVSMWSQEKWVNSKYAKPFDGSFRLLAPLRSDGKRISRQFKLSQEDGALKKAFDAYELNPDDPSAWTVLLRILAEAIEPEIDGIVNRKPPGAKKKWPHARRVKLIYAIDQIQRGASRKITDLKACERLMKAAESPLHYRKAKSAEALRHQAQEGRREMFRIARELGQAVPAVLADEKFAVANFSQLSAFVECELLRSRYFFAFRSGFLCSSTHARVRT